MNETILNRNINLNSWTWCYLTSVEFAEAAHDAMQKFLKDHIEYIKISCGIDYIVAKAKRKTKSIAPAFAIVKTFYLRGALMKKNVFATVMFFLFAFGHCAFASDVFIGTIAHEKGRLILTRCDFVQNKYVLRDKKGNVMRPVFTYSTNPDYRNVVSYAEVFGSYSQIKNENYLTVEAIDNVQPGKSCHLLDLLPK